MAPTLGGVQASTGGGTSRVVWELAGPAAYVSGGPLLCPAALRLLGLLRRYRNIQDCQSGESYPGMYQVPGGWCGSSSCSCSCAAAASQLAGSQNMCWAAGCQSDRKPCKTQVCCPQRWANCGPHQTVSAIGSSCDHFTVPGHLQCGIWMLWAAHTPWTMAREWQIAASLPAGASPAATVHVV